MSDVKRLFESVTDRTEPGVDAWRDLEHRQRKGAAKRRAGAFAAVAAVLVGAILAAVFGRGSDTSQPLKSSAPPPALSTTARLVAFDVLSGHETPVLDDVDPFRPATSPDGVHIAFLRTVEGHSEIFIADADGTHVRQVTGLAGQPGCGCGSFDPAWASAWAPGGDRIAFSGTNDAGRRGIYVLQLETGEIRRLTHGDRFETAPAWSPVDDRIAYSAGSWQADPPGSGRIFVINPLGGFPSSRPRLIVDRRGASEPSWSLDGLRIVYTGSVPGGTAIFTTSSDGDGRQPRFRLTDGTDDSSAVWSPRGDKVAFNRGNEIAILTLSTGDVQVLGIGSDPAWSSDATTVYAWSAA